MLVFSIGANARRLFSCEMPLSTNVIHCLNGIRVLSTIWIMVEHTAIMYLYLPVQNRASLTEVIFEVFMWDFLLQ